MLQYVFHTCDGDGDGDGDGHGDDDGDDYGDGDGHGDGDGGGDGYVMVLMVTAMTYHSSQAMP